MNPPTQKEGNNMAAVKPLSGPVMASFGTALAGAVTIVLSLVHPDVSIASGPATAGTAGGLVAIIAAALGYLAHHVASARTVEQAVVKDWPAVQATAEAVAPLVDQVPAVRAAVAEVESLARQAMAAANAATGGLASEVARQLPGLIAEAFASALPVPPAVAPAGPAAVPAAPVAPVAQAAVQPLDGAVRVDVPPAQAA